MSTCADDDVQGSDRDHTALMAASYNLAIRLASVASSTTSFRA